MNPLPFVKEPKAMKIAEELCPRIVHGFRSKYDFPTMITDSPTVGIEPIPTVYYAVRQGGYVIYGIFHPYDPVAPHRFDFEGALVVNTGAGCQSIASVCHLGFNFKSVVSDTATLFIEAGGHGIHLHPADFYPKHPNYIEYGKVNLVSMNFSEAEWKRIRLMFGTFVKTPDQWVDVNIENYVKQKRPTIEGVRLTTSRGLIWERPDLLFALAKKLGRLR